MMFLHVNIFLTWKTSSKEIYFGRLANATLQLRQRAPLSGSKTINGAQLYCQIQRTVPSLFIPLIINANLSGIKIVLINYLPRTTANHQYGKILLYFGFNSKSGLNLCAEIKIEFFVSFFSRMCFCLQQKDHKYTALIAIGIIDNVPFPPHGSPEEIKQNQLLRLTIRHRDSLSISDLFGRIAYDVRYAL